MTRNLLLAFIFLAAIITFFVFLGSKNNSDKYILINNVKIKVEIASTEKTRTQGLSGRTSLGKESGMLFIFSEPGHYSFWMKDMKFPLDFIWINGTKIVGLTPNAPPEGSSPINIYNPPQFVDKILEVESGTIKSDNIKIGDSVKFNNIN